MSAIITDIIKVNISIVPNMINCIITNTIAMAMQQIPDVIGLPKAALSSDNNSFNHFTKTW